MEVGGKEAGGGGGGLHYLKAFISPYALWAASSVLSRNKSFTFRQLNRLKDLTQH